MDINQVYEQHVRALPLADQLRLAERIIAHAALEAAEPGSPSRGEPLGARLRALRARIEQSGEPLLDEPALREELAANRGGAAALEQDEDANLR